MSEDNVAQANLAEENAFEQLFETAQGYFHEFMRVLRSYGIEPDPDMKLHRSKGMNSYYYLTDGQIYLALPRDRKSVV